VNQSLQHDHVFALAKVILEMLTNCIREEEQRDAFEEIYTAVKASFEHYEMMADRRMRRIRPSNN
jgi:hypothetical protein